VPFYYINIYIFYDIITLKSYIKLRGWFLWERIKRYMSLMTIRIYVR